MWTPSAGGRMAEIEKKTKRYPHANAFKITRLPGLGNHVNDQDFLVELRGFEPMAITGAGRSRATESDGGQARRAKGRSLPARTATAASTGSILSGTRSLNEPRR
jgi:hypothetical protein